jgi:hypothetical protein
MLGLVQDPALPALAALDQAALARITGAAKPRLLRARYQPGARAILHVGLDQGQGAPEGAVWFYAGDKGRKLARTLPDARLDAASGALFQTFPQDHRMPHLARFVAQAMDLAPTLIGGPALGPPDLMRYRPGLSATFRWTRADGRLFFVKQTRADDVTAQKLTMDLLAEATRDLPFGLVGVAGLCPELGLIAYTGADGQPLDRLLPGAGPHIARNTMARVITGMQALWSLSLVPGRLLDRAALLDRAETCARMIALLDPVAGAMAATLTTGLHQRPLRPRLRPIHADMKLEHVFLSGPHMTLIDTESLSLGDPDYDLAQLDARLTLAQLTGQITAAEASAAQSELRRHGGPFYDWFLTCTRMQCAKFFAQRFDPDTIPLMRQVLSPC